jgi:hypothetical protein
VRFVVVAVLVGLVGLSVGAAGCRGRLPTPVGGEGEGEGEGGLPDPDALRALVARGEAVVADVGPVVDADALPVPPAGVVAVDLGDLVVGDDGSTGAFFVDVDARVRGLTVVVYGDADALVIPTRVASPDGVLVVDGAPLPTDAPGHEQIEGLARGFTGQFASPGRVLPARRVGAFPIPSSPDVPLQTGRWRLQVGQFSLAFDDGGDPVPSPRAGAVRVVVLLRSAPVGPAGVGLALHYTGAAGLTAQTAPTAPAVVDALGLLTTVLDGVAVDVDDVIHLDVDDGDSRQTVVLDAPFCDGGELDALARLGVPDRLNVFVVDAFECGSFGPFLLGLAAGQPMVPFARTPRGGVVVAASFLAEDPELFSLAMAHELGHLAGLFHSQENDRFGQDIFDNVADTGDGEAARENLMFFDVSRIEDATLSPGQGRVVQTMPLVRP